MPNFSDEFYERWEHLISQVEISEVPIRFIREVCITFDNDDQTIFDVAHMISIGHDIEKIENSVQNFLEENDDYIKVVDFHINITALADEVGAKTSKLLDND